MRPNNAASSLSLSPSPHFFFPSLSFSATNTRILLCFLPLLPLLLIAHPTPTPPPFLPFTLFYLSRACAFPTLPRPEGLEKPRKARYFDPRVSPICGLNGWFCCIAAYTEGMRFRDSGLRFQLPCGHFFLLGSDVPKFLIRLLLLMIFMPSVGWILRVMCLWMSNSSWAYLFEALTSVILLKFGSYLVFFTLIPVCRRSLLDPGFRALSDPFFFFLIVLAHAGALGSQRARSSMVSLFSCLLSSWSLNKSLLLD